MKKLIAIALVLILALSLLPACSGGNGNTSSGGNNTPSSTPSGNSGSNNTPSSTPSGNNNTPNNSQSNSNSTSTPSASSGTPEQSPSGNNETTPSGSDNSTTTPPDTTPAAEPVNYIKGRDFSDGVIWVQAETGQWHLVDKTGKILFELDAGLQPHSDFYHGVALIIKGDKWEEIRLIDKSGKVISSPESGEYDYIAGIIPEFGLTLVCKKLVTFQLTENQVGVIDNKGNWHMQPTNDPALTELAYGKPVGYWGGTIHTFEDESIGGGYLGDGIFYLGSHRSTPAHFIDVKNGGKAWTIDFGTLYDNDCRIRSIDNGIGIFSVRNSNSGERMSGNIYSIDVSTGVINEIVSNVGNLIFDRGGGSRYYHTGEYQEGLFYVSPKDHGGYYDITGNRVIDLSEYEITDASNFSDGYALLQIKNPQGTQFYSIINKKGDFMFEPRLLEKSVISRISHGLLVINDKSNGSFKIINVSGETVTEIEAPDVADFNDGVARVATQDEVYYIDTDGNRLF